MAITRGEDVARVLIIESDLETRQGMLTALKRASHSAETAKTMEVALDWLVGQRVDVVVGRFSLSDALGERLRRAVNNAPIIVYADGDEALGAIKAGAYDVIPPNAPDEVLVASVRRAFDHHQLKQELSTLRQAVGNGMANAERMSVYARAPEEMPTLETLEKHYVDQVLLATSGNKTQAARVLGVDRRTLYRKLDRWATNGSSN